VLRLASFPPPETSHKAGTLGGELKEEKASLKTLRAELQQLKEELSDVKNEKEVVEKVWLALYVVVTRNIGLVTPASGDTVYL
jgi:hypothetical protein